MASPPPAYPTDHRERKYGQPAEDDYFDHRTPFSLPRNCARHPDKGDKVKFLIAGDTLEHPQGMSVFEE